MADGENEVEDEQVEEQKGQKGEASRDLNRAMVTREEKELDASKLDEAMTRITASDKGQIKSEREKELEKVVVRQEDIDLVMSELDIIRPVAERALRENGGDLKATLKALVNA